MKKLFDYVARKRRESAEYKWLKTAIEAGDVDMLERELADLDGPGSVPHERRDALFSLAFEKDNEKIFAALFEFFENGNGCSIFGKKVASGYPSGSREHHVLLPTYLYAALRERRYKIAFYLACHDKANVTFKGFVFGPGQKIIIGEDDIFLSPRALAHQQGATEVAGVIESRLAGQWKTRTPEPPKPETFYPPPDFDEVVASLQGYREKPPAP